jgi:hypothetical protein
MISNSGSVVSNFRAAELPEFREIGDHEWEILVGLYQMKFDRRRLKKNKSRSFRSQSSVNSSNNWTVLSSCRDQVDCCRRVDGPESTGKANSMVKHSRKPATKQSRRGEIIAEGWLVRERQHKKSGGKQGVREPCGTQGSARDWKIIQFFGVFTNNWERNDRR